MSLLGRLAATFLISLLTLMPGLASAVPQGQKGCDMVGVHHAAPGADMAAKALPPICKVQCQVPALLPLPEVAAQALSLPLQFVQVQPPRLPSRSNPPEAPPPRS